MAPWIQLKVNHTMHLRIEMFKKCSKITTDFDPVWKLSSSFPSYDHSLFLLCNSIEIVQVKMIAKKIYKVLSRDSENLAKLTSIEPKNKRFLVRSRCSFCQPVKECTPMFLIDSNIARKLWKCDWWLTKERRDSIQFLLFSQSKKGCGEWRNEKEAQDQEMGGFALNCHCNLHKMIRRVPSLFQETMK